MNYKIEIAFALINACMAWWHYRLITAQRKIQHGWWSLAYAGCLGIGYWLSHAWLIPVAGIVIRIVVFAPVLNKLRHLPFFYTNPAGTSLFDRWAGVLYVPVYIISCIALVIIQLYL